MDGISASVVSTIEGKCRKCYSCVRTCPVKAIRVENEQAQVVGELCIACGSCVRVCSQNAKRIADGIQSARRAIESGAAMAILAPSFVAEFGEHEPERVVGALKKLGFSMAFEVAWGAERVTQEYVRFLEERSGAGCIISTPCPAVVNLVEKRYPQLIPSLAPIVSPMIATARMIRKEYGDRVAIVFIGPCVAKKSEVTHEGLIEDVDAVLTFGELRELFHKQGINLGEVEPAPFDGPSPFLGRLYPVAGGLLRSAALRADILENEILTVEGKDKCLEFLEELSRGRTGPGFVDMLFCEGCIDGPMMTTSALGYTRRKLVSDFARRNAHLGSPLPRDARFPEINARREFRDRSLALPEPSPEEIEKILRELGKEGPADELNCGACGYNTCREKAIAVARGLAESRMCLPYLIGELERSNEELANLKDYNRNIVESIAEGIIVVDSNSVVTSFNDAGGRVTRQSQGPVIGRPLGEAVPGLAKPELLEAVEACIREARPFEIDSFKYELEGRPVIVNVKIYPLRNGTRRTYGAVIITEDVTEKRRLEDQLIRSEKLAALGQLAAGVAHEINTPLTLISGYTELLLRGMQEGSPERKKLSIVAEEVNRIAEIVRSLLRFARPDIARSDICDVHHALQKALDLVERQARYRGIDLTVELLPETPRFRADQGELEQVFLNIILNAIQAMPDGGSLRIRETIAGDGRRFSISFEDTGVGISPENLTRIFDPFFSTKEVGKGTGLGLFVSYGIVRKYGGDIQVRSEVGKGSQFTLEFPLDSCG